MLKQVQEEAARYRRERDEAQESWVRRVLRQMTWRCAKEGFERWCEALERVRHDKTEKVVLLGGRVVGWSGVCMYACMRARAHQR